MSPTGSMPRAIIDSSSSTMSVLPGADAQSVQHRLKDLASVRSVHWRTLTWRQQVIQLLGQRRQILAEQCIDIRCGLFQYRGPQLRKDMDQLILKQPPQSKGRD